jgi:hypothetical protein
VQERPSATFVQLTDAHLFDDNEVANSAALDWAVARVNRLAATGTAIGFVVYTGDLGLSKLPLPAGGCRFAGTSQEKAMIHVYQVPGASLHCGAHVHAGSVPLLVACTVPPSTTPPVGACQYL